MSLSADLLDHARRLTDPANASPTEVDCRRAISAAYYALFHQLVADTAAFFASGHATTDHLKQNLAQQIRRMISHTEVRQHADHFVGKTSRSDPERKSYNLHEFVLQLLTDPEAENPANSASTLVPKELDHVARSFGTLQDAREKADYVASETHTPAQAADLVAMAEMAIRDWERIRETPIAHAFLASILLAKKYRSQKSARPSTP